MFAAGLLVARKYQAERDAEEASIAPSGSEEGRASRSIARRCAMSCVTVPRPIPPIGASPR